MDAEKDEKLGPGFLDDVPMPPEALVIADRYRVIETIGRGGMGVVYKAWQENLNRVVAVKMLNSGSFAGPEEKQRFIQEAKAVAQLNHPNIVTVFDWGEDGGMPYFSMEYVAGQSLAEAIRHQPLEPQAAAEVVRSIAVAIHYAHQQGILHRDLKPANILLGREQRPKVTDFGIAKLRAADQALTASGQVLGSPGYLPPEQISMGQGAVGATCDVYSLGAVLYCALSGKAPFGAGSMAATLRQILESEPVPLRRLDPTIPRDLETICLKCLEKSPSRRYQSALDLAEELGRFLAGEPIQAKPVNLVARLGKWAKRRPVEAALTALAAMLLVAGLLGIDLKRREAVFERQRAEGMARAEARERGRADDALSIMQMQTAEDLFAKDEAGRAVAILASVVRRQPSNDIAAERLMSALAYRNWLGPGLATLNSAGQRLPYLGFSPEGQRVVTASSDGTARVWDARTGKAITEPLGKDDEVWFAHFSPDGERVVTESKAHTVRVWDSRTGLALARPLKHEARLCVTAFSSDGKQFVTASEDADGTVRLWDARTGLAPTKPWRHGSYLYNAVFSPDGKRVATAASDGSVRVWNPQTGKVLASWITESNAYPSLAFSPDGKRVVTASSGPIVTVWDVETGETIAGPLTLQLRSEKWSFPWFSPDGERVIATESDHGRKKLMARVWDVRTGELLTGTLTHELIYKDGRNSAGGGFSPDGERVMMFSDHGTVRVWDARTGRALSESLKHGEVLSTAEFSPDMERVATESIDGTVRMWDARPRKVIAETLKHGSFVMSAAFSSDGERVVTASGYTARVWDARTGKAITGPLPHHTDVRFAAFSPDGERVVTASGDRIVRVWDARTGKAIAESVRSGETSIFNVTVALSPDGERVAMPLKDCTLRIWDARSGKVLAGLSKHDEPVSAAAFSPDGKWVVTASGDGSARVWDAHTGKARSNSIKHNAEVNSTAFSPDGKRVVTASSDRTALVWDARTGLALTKPLKHEAAVNFVAFSPDGRYVVTASSDHTARLWDARTGLAHTDLLKHEREVWHAAFSPDGQRMVTSSLDKTARVWDTRTGREISEPLPHEGQVNSATFAPNGERVLTASADGTARVWDLPVGVSGNGLAEVAEAFAGWRVDQQGVFEEVSFEQARQALDVARRRAESGNGELARWLRWLLADPASRTISPNSALTFDGHIARLVEEGTENSLRQVVLLAPTNAVALARMALLCLKRVESTNMAPVGGEADFLSRRALLFAPEDPEVLGLRGQILARLERHEEALPLLTKAIETLARGTNDFVLKWLLLARAAAYRATGQPDRASIDVHQGLGIGLRPPGLAQTLIDLSPYYTAAFSTSWQNPQDRGNDLASFPTGVHKHNGVDFDVRGIVQLAGTELDQTAPGYPRHIEGIPVGQKAQRLHFLHGTGWSATNGTIIAHYRVRYSDGQTGSIPVVYGDEVRNWQFWPAGIATEQAGREPVWKGPQERWRNNWPDWGVRLYKTTWENPRPDIEIKAIDFISTMTGSAPFVIGITVE